MKKRFNLKNSIGKKNLLLTVVALVLVMLMVVGVSYSWIEQISNVEMTLGGEKSPMHISTDRLNKPAEAEINNQTVKTINLSKYFYESGNMHLSSCYSDSKTFYFPKKSNNGTNNVPTYRLGTKSDANVNYISVSFKVKNNENYEQAYWFDKNATLFSTGDTDLNKLIRCSMTIDGATSIFSASDTPTYKTVDGITAGSSNTINCQSFAAYQYDTDHNRQNDTDNTNISPTRGANGNVLFTLPAQKTSMVTIKVWLEYDNTNRSVSLSNVDLKLVTSFTKTRNLYLTDQSVYNRLDSNRTWIYSVGSSGHADLYLVLKDDTTKHWKFSETSEADHKHFVIQNFPSYYNNKDVYILRCNSSGFGTGDNDKVISGTTIHYYNIWNTVLPDTYDDRTFTVYSPNFGSWRNTDKIGYFYLIDSWNWGQYDTLNYNGVYAYMWDNNTVAEGVKTVENHKWENGAHGEPMFFTEKWADGHVPSNDAEYKHPYRIYVVYYDADFTHVIFNNNSNFQTSDLEIEEGKFYDLASNRWISNYSNGAFTNSDCYAYGNFEGGGWVERRLCSATNSGNYLYGSTYLNGNTTYEMQVKDTVNNGDKRFSDNNNGTMSSTSEWTLVENNQNKLYIHTSSSGIYWFRWNWSTHEFKVTFPFTAGSSGGTEQEQSSGGSGSGITGFTQAVSNSYVKVSESDKAQVYTDGQGNFKATLNFASATTKYYTILMGSNNFGNGQNGAIYDTDPNFNGLYVSTSNNNAFGIRAPSAGNYVISFRYDNGNTNSIFISSIAKQ